MTEPGRGPSSRPQQHNRNPSLPHRTKVLTQNPIRNGARPHSSAQEQHLKHKRIASNTARPATQNRANSAPLRPYQRDDSAKAVYDTDPVPSANTGTFLFRASVSEDRAPFDTATTSIDLARSRALDRLEEQNYQLPSSDLMPFPHDILLDVRLTRGIQFSDSLQLDRSLQPIEPPCLASTSRSLARRLSASRHSFASRRPANTTMSVRTLLPLQWTIICAT